MRYVMALTWMIGRMTIGWQGGRCKLRTRRSRWGRRVQPPVLGMLLLRWTGNPVGVTLDLDHFHCAGAGGSRSGELQGIRDLYPDPQLSRSAST